LLPLIGEVIREKRPRRYKIDVEIRRPDRELPVTRAVRGDIRTVLGEVVDNAIREMRLQGGRGKLTITPGIEGDSLVEGVGILLGLIADSKASISIFSIVFCEGCE